MGRDGIDQTSRRFCQGTLDSTPSRFQPQRCRDARRNNQQSEAQEQARRGRAALSREQGQVSRAWQELTGAELAPKTLDTLAELQGRRPQVRGMAIPQNVMEFVPERPVELDLALFTKLFAQCTIGKCVGSWRVHERDVASVFGRPRVVPTLVQSSRGHRDGRHARVREEGVHVSHHDSFTEAGWRGPRHCYIRTSFRRLVARTLARQFGKAVEATCVPFQFALSMRAGTDCVGHAIRALTAANPMTVLSIDGIGACDHVYRSASLKKLHSVPGLQGLLPFVHATRIPTKRITCGKMRPACCTASSKLKEANRETLSCHCCSARRCTTRWKRRREN